MKLFRTYGTLVSDDLNYVGSYPTLCYYAPSALRYYENEFSTMFPVPYATIKDCHVIINGNKPVALHQKTKIQFTILKSGSLLVKTFSLL